MVYGKDNYKNNIPCCINIYATTRHAGATPFRSTNHTASQNYFYYLVGILAFQCNFIPSL